MTPATRRRGVDRAGYDAAMRVPRWRCVLIAMVVLVAGCLPQPAPDLPASLLSEFGRGRPSGAAAARWHDGGGPYRRPAGDQPAGSMARGRVDPMFVVIDCHGGPDCTREAGGRPTRTVWALVYPDCKGPTGDVGWVVVDAVTGIDGGYAMRAPCEPFPP